MLPKTLDKNEGKEIEEQRWGFKGPERASKLIQLKKKTDKNFDPEN